VVDSSLNFVETFYTTAVLGTESIRFRKLITGNVHEKFIMTN